MTDTTTDKIVFVDDHLTVNPHLVEVWSHRSETLYYVAEGFTLPKGWEINGAPHDDEYEVEQGWWIFDNDAATEIIDDVGLRFEGESNRDVVGAIMRFLRQYDPAEAKRVRLYDYRN